MFYPCHAQFDDYLTLGKTGCYKWADHFQELVEVSFHNIEFYDLKAVND